ncbi:MAG: ribonuclease E inhibitor RraB [Fimbriimonadaceae bacterium]
MAVGILPLLVLCVIVLGIVLLISSVASRTRRDMPMMDEGTRGTGPDDQVINQLRMAGSDLTKPHVIDFFLYFPTDEAANSVRIELGSDYQCEISQSGEKWLCQAHCTFVPTRASLVLRRQALTALAAKYGGEYDGWGAAIVR